MFLSMNNLIFTLIAGVMICSLHSCANNKQVEELKKVKEEKVDQLVARVSSVNLSANYVLIQRYGRLVVPEDSVLYTLGSSEEQGKAANIKLTGEKLGQFLAADIVSGQIKVGDSVYLRDLTEVKKESKALTPLDKDSVSMNEKPTQIEMPPADVTTPEQGGELEEVELADDTLLPVVE